MAPKLITPPLSSSSGRLSMSSTSVSAAVVGESEIGLSVTGDNVGCSVDTAGAPSKLVGETDGLKVGDGRLSPVDGKAPILSPPGPGYSSAVPPTAAICFEFLFSAVPKTAPKKMMIIQITTSRQAHFHPQHSAPRRLLLVSSSPLFWIFSLCSSYPTSISSYD